MNFDDEYDFDAGMSEEEEIMREKFWKEQNESLKKMLQLILDGQKEVINTPLRGEWVPVAHIKEIFKQRNIEIETPF